MEEEDQKQTLLHNKNSKPELITKQNKETNISPNTKTIGEAIIQKNEIPQQIFSEPALKKIQELQKNLSDVLVSVQTNKSIISPPETLKNSHLFDDSSDLRDREEKVRTHNLGKLKPTFIEMLVN